MEPKREGRATKSTGPRKSKKIVGGGRSRGRREGTRTRVEGGRLRGEGARGARVPIRSEEPPEDVRRISRKPESQKEAEKKKERTDAGAYGDRGEKAENHRGGESGGESGG